MSVEAVTAENQALPKPRRKLRNYLLDPQFQMKYVGMVVGVTFVVASVLGALVYDFSTSLTESMMANELLLDEYQGAASFQQIQESAEAADRRVLMWIVLGVLTLVVALGLTGIVVTHKVVGPAYKMRLLVGEIGEGKLTLSGRLRRGDELQTLFESVEEMIDRLRDEREGQIGELDRAIDAIRADEDKERAIAALETLRNKMASSLE